jgi:pyruvate formate lyase activating enzyme
MENGELETKGLIFDIQRYCIHDGPGVRTVVFLKGCPMRCDWCCNPESISFKPELMIFETTCMGCRQCVDVCPHQALSIEDEKLEVDRSQCDCCGKCSEVCPTQSIQIRGFYKSVPEVIEEVERDYSFYRNSGGGITLSGGEPTAQPKFSIKLLSELQNLGIHTAIETNGYAEWSLFEPIVQRSDLILFDLKHMNSELHERYTGLPNQNILRNLKKASQLGKTIILRVPVIPGINDSITNMVDVANLIKELKGGIKQVDLLSYHRLGVLKYQRLGMTYPLNGAEPPDPERIEEIACLFQAYDLKVKIGG